jgi:hypothetical protein
MNPPNAWNPIHPSSQSTSKITNIVQSIRILSVGSHVPSWDGVPVRLSKAKFLHGSPVCSVSGERPRLEFFHYRTQVPIGRLELSTGRFVIALR